ncbi:MAG: SMP-30/gluconolactonase/LRE family protein [Reichenbachiella sp.]|uniref:SMP-30/gluconolactonase/LRE family protein n=1 Tax=Reichenbachiella sp. TaxID=2184521 RepID=UPI003266C221
MNPELVLHVNDSILGEGPVWDHRVNQLWWVDIPRGLVYCYDPENEENKTYSVGQMVGAAIPCEEGGLILALENGFAFFDPKNHQMKPIFDPESNIPTNRFNDAKCDPKGRLWAGTMRTDPPRDAVGSLYCLDSDLKTTKKLSGIKVSNGLAWTSKADKMFYIDTRNNVIMSFDYEIETGNIYDRSDFLTFDTLLPDGMCIDENDNLWVAFYSGASVCCFDTRNGNKLEQIDMPVANPTSCAFGGKVLDTLYITTAANDGKDDGGALFAVKPGVKGCKTNFFKYD